MALVPLNNDDLKEYAVLHNDIVDKYSFKDLTERVENILIVLLSKLQKQEAFSKESFKKSIRTFWWVKEWQWNNKKNSNWKYAKFFKKYRRNQKWNQNSKW